jgi:chromosome segregation protein
MVEDALGLKAYHYKKEEALRKLEKTRENLEKIESIRREIRPHLRFLEKQVEKVAKARELAADLVEAYREYFAREKFYLETERKRLERELSPKKRRADELQKEIERARAELQKLSEKGTESDDLLHAEEAMRHARDEKDEAVRDVGRIEGEIRALETLIVREEKKASEDAHRTVPFSSVASFSQSLLTRLSDAERTQDLSVLKKLFGELKSAVVQFVETLSGQSHASQEELRELKGRLAELSAKKDALSRAVEDIEKRETEREREYKNIQHTIEQDIHSGRDMERAIFSLSNEQQEVRMSLQTLEGALSSLALEDEEYARELLEAGALAGRQAVQFDDVFKTLLAADAVAPRGEQHERKRHIEKQKVRLEDAGSGTGEDIMKEYDDVRERDAFLEKEVTDLTASTDSLGTLIADLNETLAREFAHGIEKINEQFSSFFSLMFGGGTASLAVTKEIRRARRDTDVSDSEEAPEEEVPEAGEEGAEVVVEGVEIHVSLPRKKIRGLEMLSGGERALTSIALIFAMSQVNPPPFIILDETDAALDEANSRRYGDMIENLAAKTQLILITHNRETMSRAGVLYGVTMGQDAVSQLLSVSFSEAVAVAK